LSVSLGGRPILKDLNAQVRGRADRSARAEWRGKDNAYTHTVGILPSDRGSALILGKDVALASKEVRALIGYMPERDSSLQR